MHYAPGTYPEIDDEYEPNSADEEAEREIERLASTGAVPDPLDAQLAQMEVNKEAIGILHIPPAVEHPLGSSPQPTTDYLGCVGAALQGSGRRLDEPGENTLCFQRRNLDRRGERVSSTGNTP